MAVAVGVVCVGERPSAAAPQASAGLTLGAAFDGLVGPGSPGTAAGGSATTSGGAGVPPAATLLHVGVRGDLLLLRGQDRDMAVGPYVDVATAGFHEADAGGGAEWLVPLTADVSIVAAAGAFARSGAGRDWAAGGEGNVFVGSRSYNFHSWYGLAVGGFVQARWVPVSPATLDVVAGVQLDMALLAMPFLFVYTALAH